MTDVRRICSVLVISGCATGTGDIEPFLDSNKADGHPPKLHAIDSHRLHVDEPSDLAFVGHQLYTVSDRHSKIYAISTSGDVQHELDVAGKDLEALAFDPVRGEFVIGDEATAKVWHLDATGARDDGIELQDAEDGNSGIEGLAFDPAGHLFVAKEKDPAKIFEVAGATQIDRDKLGWIADISALAFHGGHLFVLSDQDEALYRVDAGYHAELAWRLPVKNPEGLAFDGTRLYVCSDSEERLYELELDDN